MLEVNSDFTINCRYVKNVHAQSQGQDSNWNENTYNSKLLELICCGNSIVAVVI